MEYGLGVCKEYAETSQSKVLILIVVEYGLGVGSFVNKETGEELS